MLQNTLELIQDALKKSGEKTDGTSDYQSDALGYMDSLYRSILSGGNEFNVNLGEPWTWAKAKYPGVLTLIPPYTNGTVSLTQSSSLGVFSSPPSSSQAGCFLRVSSEAELYRITSHVAGAAAFTLDSGYNGDTTSASEFTSLRLDYDLSAANILRQIGPMKVYRTQSTDGDCEGKINGLDLRSFEKKSPMYRIENGVPTDFAIVFNDTSTGTITVRFNKYVNALTRVDYDYIPVPTPLANSLTSIPVIPDGFRQALSYATAFSILMDKEDSKSKEYFTLTQAKLQAMVNANRKEFMQISKNRGRLVPRLDDYQELNWPTSD